MANHSPPPYSYLEFPVPSDSRPGLSHKVKLWQEDWRGFKRDSLSCDCEHWIYQRKPLTEKSCKHTRRIAMRLEQTRAVERIVGSEVTFNEQVLKGVQKRNGVDRWAAVAKELGISGRVKGLLEGIKQ